MKYGLTDLANIGNVVCGIVAIVALFISILTYTHTVKKERRMNTLSAISDIRKKYFNTRTLDDHEKLQYLNELEYFATGINMDLYDISVVYKMSGSRLIKQYETWAKQFIEARQNQFGNQRAYCEYEEMIRKLLEEKQKGC